MRKTIPGLKKMKGETPIVMVTAYDATMARLVDQAVDAILVGDSLGMVVQGRDSTLPVTLEEMVYHTGMVYRGSESAVIIADLPFLSFQPSVELAVLSAGKCLKEASAQAVKLEGGGPVLPQVRAITDYGIPVVAHLGLTPQGVNSFGGYGKQAKNEPAAGKLLEEAQALEEAGASLLVLENIPHDLAGRVTEALAIPTIGIGAGPSCDGQVQVFHDLLGLIPDFLPRHAKRYDETGKSIVDAIARYAQDVRQNKFVSE